MEETDFYVKGANDTNIAKMVTEKSLIPVFSSLPRYTGIAGGILEMRRRTKPPYLNGYSVNINRHLGEY